MRADWNTEEKHEGDGLICMKGEIFNSVNLELHQCLAQKHTHLGQDRMPKMNQKEHFNMTENIWKQTVLKKKKKKDQAAFP